MLTKDMNSQDAKPVLINNFIENPNREKRVEIANIEIGATCVETSKSQANVRQINQSLQS